MADFWIGVLQNVVGDVLAAGAIAASLAVTAFVRFSGLPRLYAHARPVRHPSYRVVESPLHPTSRKVVLHDPSPFRSPLHPHEREALVAFYDYVNNTHPTNGQVVRLDSLAVSVVGFFDFLATNLTAFPANLPLPHLSRQIGALTRWVRVYPLIRTVRRAIGETHTKSLQAILLNECLGNIAAVNVLVIDSENRVGLVERPGGLAVASGRYAATATGTVAINDLQNENPFWERRSANSLRR
jgi:hypothetical protein